MCERLPFSNNLEGRFPELSEFIEKHPGETKIDFEVKLQDIHKRVTLQRPDAKGIGPSGEFFEGLYSLFGRMDFVEIRS